MPSPKKPFRINLGFIAHEEIGRNHDFPFDFEKIDLGEDFIVRDLSGNVNIGKTPQGLVVRGEFSGNTSLECVRCLTKFDTQLSWELTELYAFDDRSATEADLILPEDAHIDLAVLVREYGLLEMPINPICKYDCNGLCIDCGQNLNERDCGHGPDLSDSPFAKLKDLL